MHFIKSAEHINNYKIKLIFDDNKEGIIDFSYLLERDGIYQQFKDFQFFKSFFVNNDSNTIEWPNEIDLCPDNLYNRLFS